jgi:hypothetical protein
MPQIELVLDTEFGAWDLVLGIYFLCYNNFIKALKPQYIICRFKFLFL